MALKTRFQAPGVRRGGRHGESLCRSNAVAIILDRSRQQFKAGLNELYRCEGKNICITHRDLLDQNHPKPIPAHNSAKPPTPRCGGSSTQPPTGSPSPGSTWGTSRGRPTASSSATPITGSWIVTPAGNGADAG